MLDAVVVSLCHSADGLQTPDGSVRWTGETVTCIGAGPRIAAIMAHGKGVWTGSDGVAEPGEADMGRKKQKTDE
jgi:hypothetical protein